MANAYDNPTIIKDLYGVGGYADMAKTIAQSVKESGNIMRANREKQADIAQKKKDLYNRSYASAELAANKTANANYQGMEDAGADKSIVDQAKTLLTNEMYGGKVPCGGPGEVSCVGGKPGERGTRDFGIGSIKAEAELKNNLNLDKKTRKSYNDIISRQSNNMKGFAKEAGFVLADREDAAAAKIAGANNGYYYEGRTEAEQYTSYLVSNSLFEENNPEDFKAGERTYDKEYNPKTGKDETTLRMSFTVNEKSPLAAAYSDREKYPIDKDGNISIKWSKNLSDGTFDGNLVNKQSEELYDANEEAKSFMQDGTLNKQFQVSIPAELNTDDATAEGYDQKLSKTWVNLEKFEQGMEKSLDTKAGRIVTLFRQNPMEAKAYLEQIGRPGIDFEELVASGKMTDEQLHEIFKGYEKDAMMSHFGLGDERDEEKYLGLNDKDELIDNPNYGKFTKQRVNKMELVKGVITEEQVQYLKDQGVAAGNLPEVGTMQYFQVAATDVKEGKGTDGNKREGSDEVIRANFYSSIFAGTAKTKAGRTRNAKDFFNTPRKLPNSAEYLVFLNNKWSIGNVVDNQFNQLKARTITEEQASNLF